MTWIANPGRPPRNPNAEWWLRFRCGHQSLRPYRGAQMRWTLIGSDWDIAEAARADGIERTSSTWTPVSGGY